MEVLDETLYARVDDLIRSHQRQQLLSTTGSQLSIAELTARSAGHDEALRAIALEVQKLSASLKS